MKRDNPRHLAARDASLATISHATVDAADAAPGVVFNVSRRGFMKQAGGLALGVCLAPLARAATAAGAATPKAAAAASATAVNAAANAAASHAAFAPNAFIRIDTDGTVSVVSKHLEMGQGTFTGLATLAAEELDADWSKVKVVAAPADRERYSNLAFGKMKFQGTGGSTAMAASWQQMRKAGATARAMLVSAAAERWNVPASSITVRQGVVSHAVSGRSAGFGELAAAAAKLTPPTDVPLKDPSQFTLIGKTGVHRKDSPAKVNGTAVFTQDVKLPGMLVASVARPPKFGATVKHVDASKARAIRGVVAVVQYPGTGHSAPGVAVLAANTWIARQGRDALRVEWDESHAFTMGTQQMLAHYRELAGQPADVAAKRGDVDRALQPEGGAKIIEADYVFPYLAHASMEPMNCAMHVTKNRCEIWNGEQWQTMDQINVARVLGLAPEQVVINQVYAGGSFGRRANPTSDYLCETAAIVKAAQQQGVKAPIKLVWMREDDMRAGSYRPFNVHRLRAAVSSSGELTGWHHRIVCQSFLKGSGLEAFIQNGIDGTIVEGAADLPYAIPNLRVEQRIPEDVTVPVQWYRSVGHTHTAFATETLIDEAAHIAGKDPYQFRRALLTESPRERGVLDAVAKAANWDQPLAAGAAGERRGRGIALQKAFNTYVAQVVEVTVKSDGTFKVNRVVCAVDCGVAINPDVVRAQMEGGIGFGLAMTLYGAITLNGGEVEQSNFHNYRMLRIDEMPVVEVHIVPSAEAPTGVGEPGVPPVAPAVANALAAATGVRIRELPVRTPLVKT